MSEQITNKLMRVMKEEGFKYYGNISINGSDAYHFLKDTEHVLISHTYDMDEEEIENLKDNGEEEYNGII